LAPSLFVVLLNAAFAAQPGERNMAFTNYMMGGAAITTALGLIAVALPDTKRVERTSFVAAPVEAVYERLSSTAGFQTFNPYADSEPDLKITPSGPASGIGASFAFAGKDAKGTQTIVAVEANKSVTMQIDLGDMGKPVQKFTLTSENGGTRVTWATESNFGYNPVKRVFGLFMDGFLGPTYERGLENLAKVSAARN
jgi:carbon monoxide dehydrogenase subunit G